MPPPLAPRHPQALPFTPGWHSQALPASLLALPATFELIQKFLATVTLRPPWKLCCFPFSFHHFLILYLVLKLYATEAPRLFGNSVNSVTCYLVSPLALLGKFEGYSVTQKTSPWEPCIFTPTFPLSLHPPPPCSPFCSLSSSKNSAPSRLVATLFHFLPRPQVIWYYTSSLFRQLCPLLSRFPT